jgi:hypothetical protein
VYFIVLCILFACLSGCTPSSKIEQECIGVSKIFKEMQDQLPMQADAGTTITGLNAYYSVGECHSNVSMIINVKKMAEIVSLGSENTVTKDQAYSYLLTDKGIEFLHSIANSKFDKKISSKEFPSTSYGFVFKEMVTFSEESIPRITLVHRNK